MSLTAITQIWEVYGEKFLFDFFLDVTHNLEFLNEKLLYLLYVKTTGLCTYCNFSRQSFKYICMNIPKYTKLYTLCMFND